MCKNVYDFTNLRCSMMDIKKKVEAGSKDYQLLCANCNQKKRYENGEGVKL
jgi:hypothetical protein